MNLDIIYPKNNYIFVAVIFSNVIFSYICMTKQVSKYPYVYHTVYSIQYVYVCMHMTFYIHKHVFMQINCAPTTSQVKRVS